MPQKAKAYDPLHWVPSPDLIREKLRETLHLADRLKLLDLAEKLQLPLSTADRLPTPPKGVPNAG